MSTSRARGLRIDAARNHDRIIVAAGRTFEEIGPTVTLEEVARRADVGIATVYRRFRTRDQLVRAVFEHLVSADIEPTTRVETNDPWHDLATALEATVEVLAGRQVLLRLAHETEAIHVEGLHRYLSSMERLLRRAGLAGLVRAELEVRDLAAVVVMALATVHPGDPRGADRRRYLALLLDGLRPARAPLPEPATYEFPHGPSPHQVDGGDQRVTT